MTQLPRVDVLGVAINVLDPPAAIAEITRWVEERLRHYVCFTGVHGVMECLTDSELGRIHNSSGLTAPDGMPMVWAAKWAGAQGAERVAGPDLMPAICEVASRRGWSSFFYGGGDGVAELLAGRLRERFPGLRVAGTWTPPFRDLTENEDAEVVDLINRSGADLVWVGLSTPKQERWMDRHRARLDAPVLLGVGAAFDIHAGLLPRAPRWMQLTGTEWLYRLGREPRRLWRRYLSVNPRFVVAILRNPPRLLSISDGAGPMHTL